MFISRARRLVPIVAALVGWTLTASPVAAHGDVPAAAPDFRNLLVTSAPDPFVAIPLLLSAVLWWRLLDGIDRGHPAHPVPRWQRWAFLAGLAAIAIALQSGMADYDTTLFSVHMVQHLLLTLVAPPLLALGAPITQALRAASPSVRRKVLLPILHSRVIRTISHPVVAWLAFTAVMWGTHFSPIFNESLTNPPLHDGEHVLFLVAGLLFWWPVIGLDPAPHRIGYPARIAYVFLQMPQSSFLAMAILFANEPLYAHYATLGSPYGIDALSDQRLAAGIMWVVGDLIFLMATLALIAAWMRHETRTAVAQERRDDVERAAISEREDLLRRRRGMPARDQTVSRAADGAALRSGSAAPGGHSSEASSISDR